jgi:hypothetical protein
MVRTCDVTLRVLRETDNSAVCTDDVGLCNLIAGELGWRTNHPLDAAPRLMNVLARTPGDLVPGKTRGARGNLIRIFRVPE